MRGKLDPEEIGELEDRFEEARRPLEFLSTDGKQKNYFRSLPTFIEPVKYSFGQPRFETDTDPDGTPCQRMVFDTWQYVPIAKTLEVVLSQREIADSVQNSFNNCRADGIIEEFEDALLFRKLNKSFADKAHRTIALDIYYDDIETTNPLGSKTTIHKVGVFYFVIRNLPSLYDSCMDNIQGVSKLTQFYKCLL